MKLFFPFAKIDQPQRMVYGYASTEAIDSQGEVVRKEALAAALPEYLRFANIREMHQPSAVGVAKEAAVDDKGLYLGAKIVDAEAWQKVIEGVYKGFSIGGWVTERDGADPSIITGLELAEISLVDRPANPEAVFALFKLEQAAKVGARHSKVDLARVQGIHDMAAALGACCPGGDSEDADEGADAAGGEDADGGDDADESVDKRAAAPTRARLAAAERQVEALAKANASLTRRIAALEQRPLEGKAVLRAVDKSADRDGAAEAEPKDTLSLIRRAYQNARIIRFMG